MKSDEIDKRTPKTHSMKETKYTRREAINATLETNLKALIEIH